MNQVIEVIDARSDVKEFERHLKQLGLLPRYRHAYATDAEYKAHGFDFIQSMTDAEDFLNELDTAVTSHSGDVGPCTKAFVIRQGMTKSWYKEDKLDQFKAVAARARRTCCGCHHVGSYHVKFNGIS
mgnify:CR=1 FL=1|tara:strand:+ start:3044 stop:3424 length:381 start_codon:yes stop_codon:yes gene_type:complete